VPTSAAGCVQGSTGLGLPAEAFLSDLKSLAMSKRVKVSGSLVTYCYCRRSHQLSRLSLIPRGRKRIEMKLPKSAL
jgi:hypothetical protein